MKDAAIGAAAVAGAGCARTLGRRMPNHHSTKWDKITDVLIAGRLVLDCAPRLKPKMLGWI